MGLYNRFCKRFFAAVIVRTTAQADSRALVPWGTKKWFVDAADTKIPCSLGDEKVGSHAALSALIRRQM